MSPPGIGGASDYVRPICWCADLVVLSPLDVLASVWLSYHCLKCSSCGIISLRVGVITIAYRMSPEWDPVDEVHKSLRYLLAIAHLCGFCIAKLFGCCGGKRVQLAIRFFMARSRWMECF